MDKQELRQDPIRERLIGALTYLENNKNALFGVLAVIVIVISYGGYYSSSTKALKVESSQNLGKALITFSTDKDSGILLLSKVLEEGDDASKQVAMATLVNHYFSSDQSFEVDSLLNMDIKITDDVLSSKLLTLKGDIRSNNEDYEAAIEAYEESADVYPSLDVELKIAEAHYKLGKNDKAKKIVESILENEDASATVKSKSSVLKSRL